MYLRLLLIDKIPIIVTKENLPAFIECLEFN